MITKETAPYQQFIQEFTRCSAVCYECLNAMLDEPDINDRKRCLKLLLECARMCEMSAFVMSLDGKFVKRHCELCAEMCDVCAQECALFEDTCSCQCSKELRRCADACAEMLHRT